MKSGQFLVILIVVLLVAAAITPLLFRHTLKGQPRLREDTESRLALITQTAQRVAAEAGDRYPAHMATLVIDKHLNDARMFRSPVDAIDGVWTVSDLIVTPGGDWSGPELKAAAEAQIGPHGLGFYHFAGHDAPTRQHDVIFAWSDPLPSAMRVVAFDDGEVQSVDDNGFRKLLAADDAARRRLGLESILGYVVAGADR